MNNSNNLGRMPAALLLLTHDDSKGRARLGTQLLSCGLLATQLAELALSGKLIMRRDQTGFQMWLRRDEEHSRTTTATTLEQLVAQHVDQMSRTQNPTVKLLHRAIGTQAHDLELRRLVTEGIMRTSTERKVLGRRQEIHRTVSAWHATRPLALIVQMLEQPARVSVGGGFIICVLDELGSADLLRDHGISGTQLMRVANSFRPTLPAPLEPLLQQLHEAVNSIVDVARF